MHKDCVLGAPEKIKKRTNKTKQKQQQNRVSVLNVLRLFLYIFSQVHLQSIRTAQLTGYY